MDDKQTLQRWADMVLDGKPINTEQAIRQQAARIAELEATEQRFNTFMATLAAIGPHAGKPDSHIEALLDKVKRVGELEATARELREAVTLLAELIECYERQDKLRADDNASCGDLFLADKNQDHAWNNVHLNPIAAAAVREAGR